MSASGSISARKWYRKLSKSGPFRETTTQAMPAWRAIQADAIADCALSIDFTEISMSSPQLRRADRAMSAQQASAMLERGFSGRLATVGADGYPYCIPLLYIRKEGEIYVHTGSAMGHLRADVEREPSICVEMHDPHHGFEDGRLDGDTV